MVENETIRTFAYKFYGMDIQDVQDYKTINVGKIQNGLSHCMMDYRSCNNSKIVLCARFYFVLVIEGTAFVSDNNKDYILTKGDLLVLTPSITVIFDKMKMENRISCISISPDYFETLRDGRTVYNQLASFFHDATLPVIHLETRYYEYLKNTVTLFDELLCTFTLNGEGVIRHLCGFYLLQITNALYKSGTNSPTCVVRSHEIYCLFKKLVVEHYRHQHSISFYADNLHITTTYLSRIIKAVTGQTVHSIISELIYADAIKYLDCTDMDIKEIAEILGFSDQSAFGKFFSKKANLSPMKFRLRRGSLHAPQKQRIRSK